MTQDKPKNSGAGASKTALGSAGTVVYDEKKKLSELQAMILRKGDVEREHILEAARVESQKWLDEQTKQLDAMVAVIRSDAMKRSQEVTSRQLIEAETARDKDRLRLQNELVQKALVMFQDTLISFAERPDYAAILTGLAAKVCEELPEGERQVKMRLRAEDAPHGDFIVNTLKRRFPKFDFAFDAAPAPILGGVLFYSEEGKWRVAADWKSIVEDMAGAVAKAVLAVL
jgi:vacuolar-type H+-ATPase subunit E/Vma4